MLHGLLRVNHFHIIYYEHAANGAGKIGPIKTR
jgi:hypothetical protein